MSDDEDDREVDERDIPDSQTCQALVEEFAALTKTDTACAQFFLQDRKWDLNRSVNAFFEAQKREGVQVLDDGDEPEVVITFESFAAAMAAATGSLQCTPTSLKFVSWNVDGLDSVSRSKRLKRICNIINCELPDVVHLQEIIPEMYSAMQTYLPAFKCIPGNDPVGSDYFTTTLIRTNSVTYEGHDVVPFPGSAMGRTLLIVKATISGKPLTLLNTHLESTAEFSKERKQQLKTAFKKVLAVDSSRTVILAGDLNLRDKELAEVGGLPATLEDLWLVCGKRPECEFTWDGRRNTNINMPYSYKTRCRFDRAYVRHADNNPVTPKHFGLIGLEKIPSCGRFPSDHWGLMINFEI